MSDLVVHDRMSKDRAATSCCRVHRLEPRRCVLAVAVQSKGGSSPIAADASGVHECGADSGRPCRQLWHRSGARSTPCDSLATCRWT